MLDFNIANTRADQDTNTKGNLVNISLMLLALKMRVFDTLVNDSVSILVFALS